MEWIEKIVWHKVVTRQPTEEDIEEFAEWGLAEDEYPPYIFDCELPDDNREILALGKSGYSIYLDNNGDWDDVVAWAYLPTGKKNEEAANAS